MGYSVYASRVSPAELPEDDDLGLTEEDLQAFRAARIRLCGLSHKNPAHFEGWDYHHILRNATGMSLYDEWVPPEQVRKVHEALVRAKENERKWNIQRSRRERTALDNLLRFMEICVERELGLMC